MVDYFLLHQNDFKYVKQYAVMPPNEFSDPCALHICIERKQSDVMPREAESSAPELFTCWDDTQIDTFRNSLLDNSATLEQVTDSINSVSIDRSFRYGRTHGAPFRGYGYVPLRNGGNVVTRMGTQQQRSFRFSGTRTEHTSTRC